MSKKTKTKTKTKMADFLPEEIIPQILHKLPIKSLVRFTCVSKTWLSMIKNPTFISTHRNLSISSSNKNPFLLLRNYHTTNSFSLYFDKEENNHYMHLHSPLNTQNPEYCFSVVGTINGLICLYDNSYNITIWNPFIKKSVTLPKPRSTCFCHLSFGFGFDSLSNDYKVLRLAQTLIVPDEDDGKLEYDRDTLEAEIYSLNTNSWKRICAPRYEIKNRLRQAFVNGVIHVLAFRGPIDDSYRNVILGFNLGDEVFKEIALPQSLAHTLPLYLNLLVYKESIAVFDEDDFIGSGEKHVWVMEEYGVVESWTRMIFSFNGQEEQLLPPWVSGFRKNGELFFKLYGGEMVSCEVGSREIKSLTARGSGSFVDYFVESMDLLDNANAQSDPTVENDATCANDVSNQSD